MELEVFVGMFRYVEDGNIELVVATTEQRAQQELIDKMRDYLAPLYEVVPSVMSALSNNWDLLREIGCDNRYYEVEITKQVVLSEQHILKHLIRQSSGVE
tara:strand:- start:2022 stop:2321 length:300 start_codon:yes stop_codon:yes gene_type:complete